MPEKDLLNDNRTEAASIDKNNAAHSQDVKIPSAEVDENAPASQSQGDEQYYVAIKGTFFTPKADNAGAFCVIYREKAGKVIFRELWAVRSNTHPALDTEENWEGFIKGMDKIGAYDRDASEKLQPVIEQSLSSNVKEYLFKNIKEIETVHSEIRKALENVFRYVIELKIGAELVEEQRIQKAGILRGDKEESGGEKPKEDNKTVLGALNLAGVPIICQPIINPVNGCPVSRLKVGDVVYVSIPETNEIAKKVMDFVRINGLNAAFPVTIIHPLESGKCVIVLKVNEEINGILNISQEVMLKTEKVYQTEEKSLFESIKQHINPINSILLCGVILFIVLLYLMTQFINF